MAEKAKAPTQAKVVALPASDKVKSVSDEQVAMLSLFLF
ncbi:MAG: hypothetical protein JWN15_4331 [Firmicutes bacterium]|jgi:hypothetical protein|nr:hypothetical protein [Bacillota bacterium]